MLNLTVNGKNREINQSQDLVSFLQSYGVNLNFIAVALNGNVLDPEDFSRIVLKEGDVLEIVRPVGGGSHLPSFISPTVSEIHSSQESSLPWMEPFNWQNPMAPLRC